MPKKCIIDDCKNLSHAKGMCSKHYSRYVRNGNPLVKTNMAYENMETRLSRYIVSEDGCWEWAGTRNWQNYGTLTYYGKFYMAHRASYEFHNKTTIPPGMLIMHKCDNPCCINPEHLVLGTYLTNSQDAVAKGRQPRGERGGNAKLSNASAIQIKLMTKEGVMPAAIARKLGVTLRQVYGVKYGDCWNWLVV